MRVPDPTAPKSVVHSTSTESQKQYTVEYFKARLDSEINWMQVEREGRQFRLIHRSPRILSSTPRLFTTIAMNLDCTCLILCSNFFAQVPYPQTDDSSYHKMNKNDLAKIQAEVKRVLEQDLPYDLLFIENDENIDDVIKTIKEVSSKTAIIVFLFREDTTKVEILRKKGVNVLEASDLHNQPLADFYIAQALGDEGIKGLRVI